MKIVTWNINGIRTFKGGVKAALDALDADIVCVQETKVTRDLLDERSAIVEGYNSYFSFSRGRSGYSGVATYCKDSAAPFAAEEGLTGLLSTQKGTVGSYGDPSEFSDEELQLLDNEGRAVITQHRFMCQNEVQTVVVVNVYCPRADPEKPERKQFKLQFYKLLQSRAEAILKAGSHVIVLGDVNTSHREIDHCDPDDIDDFEEHPGRKWLDVFLCNGSKEKSSLELEVENEKMATDSMNSGKFIDTFRYFHPSRTNAFTCWCTLTGARQTNYGTRIDYIFADNMLVKELFVAADIMPEVEGSDHCPVWAQLSCSLLASPKFPPLCTCYLPEFAGKQQKLSRFLVKVDSKSIKSGSREPLPSSQDAEEKRENVNPLRAENNFGKKRTLAPESVVPKGKKSKVVKTSSKPQKGLLAFFKPKPPPAVPAVEDQVSQCVRVIDQGPTSENSPEDKDPEGPQGVRTSSPTPSPSNTLEETNKNTRTEVESERPTSENTPARVGPKKGASLVFWKSVLHGPPPPPPCKVHGEPCVLRTVKKEGPNLGKQFFVCCRPQGHASNPEARCNFFLWVDKKK